MDLLVPLVLVLQALGVLELGLLVWLVCGVGTVLIALNHWPNSMR